MIEPTNVLGSGALQREWSITQGGYTRLTETAQ